MAEFSRYPPIEVQGVASGIGIHNFGRPKEAGHPSPTTTTTLTRKHASTWLAAAKAETEAKSGTDRRAARRAAATGRGSSPADRQQSTALSLW